MGGSVMFSCRTSLPLDVKSFKKVSLKYKAESETLVLKKMEHSAYVPRVENISPALPVDDVKDDIALQVSKDDLLHQITNIDKKISHTEAEIKGLSKRMMELQKAADLAKVGNEEEEVKKPQSPTLAIKIYAENKRKLQESDILWEKLGPKIVMPLYNQPSDTTVYHENRKKHLVFKYCLLKYLKFKQAENSLQENYLIALYMEKQQEWLNKVKAIESSLAHKKKEAEKKIVFEKEFPKLRKQIEEKLKQRLSQIESHFGTADKGKSACAIICPILLPSRQQEFNYVNNNGLIEDLRAEYREWQLINVWTDAEKAIFKEKFLQHPKQFGIIASYLDQKTIPECVKYYYQSKQTENYKSLLKKTRKRTHMSCNGLPAKRANVSQLNSGKVLGGQAGCLQMDKEPRQGLYSAAAGNDVEPSAQSSLVARVLQPSVVDTGASRSAVSSTSSPAVTSDASVMKTVAVAASPVPPAAQPVKVESSHNQGENKFEDAGMQSDTVAPDVTECDPTKQDERTATPHKEHKSLETNADVHNGIVRSIMLDHSKHLPQPDVSQYSVCEERAMHGAQVPSTCSCKFRGGCYTHCQVLTYQNSLSQMQQCSTKWNDSLQKQAFLKEDDEARVNPKSDVGRVSESYASIVSKNYKPFSVLPTSIKERSIPETAMQSRVHSLEKHPYGIHGNQNHPAVTKCSEESYRSLVIKTTSSYDEGANLVDNNLHQQPLKLGNGIVKPLTSSASEDVSVNEGAAAKQVHSVKDLVMEVIEKQIMKNFGRYDDRGSNPGESKAALAPTLSSILQTHHLAGRSQSNFTPGLGFQGGDENRSLHLPQDSSVPTSYQAALSSGEKQHTPPMTTYQVLTSNARLSQEYLPERREANFLGVRNFQDAFEVGKHRSSVESVISTHRRPPLLPTPAMHPKHYPHPSVHQVSVHSSPHPSHSSPVYLSRGNMAVNHVRHQSPVQDNEGTLDLSTKKPRAYHTPEDFPRGQPYQPLPMQQPLQMQHYLGHAAMQTMQRKVLPQELLPPTSSSVPAHRNRYASVISQSVIVRDQGHNYSGEQPVASGPASSASVQPSTHQVKAMPDIYKPYFP